MSRLNRIGVYWSVMHRRPQDYEYFKRLRPTVIKIMDGGPNDYAWVKANLPYSLVIARDWALSEQHDDMRRDPIGTGRRHAEEWDAHADRLGFDRAKTLILGINEPQVWEAGVPEALRQYTIALCDRAAELDLRVGAMQLSVGWPANNGPDTPPDWSPFAGVEDAIRRGNHMLVCHEYWADSGPGENWGWWAGRSLKCPWRVPIVIGECGIDMYVKDPSVPHTARGWQGRMHPTRYAAELAEYVTRMDTDARFVGACVFASDFANREWWSFDVEPAYDAILATRNLPDVGGNSPSVPGAGHKAYLPHVPVGSQPSGPTAVVSVPAGANVRQEPSTAARILGAVPAATPLRVTGKLADGSWLEVQSEWGAGWVSGTVVTPHNTDSVPVRETQQPQPKQPAMSNSPGIIDPLTALAFLQVESGNRAFTDGLLTIRFEVHRFKDFLKNDALFDRHFKFTPRAYNEQYWRRSPDAPWQHAHGNMAARHELLRFARSLNDAAALNATGMGMAQIMGHNAQRVGYPSPAAMFQAFSHQRYGVNAQLMGFVNYVLSNSTLADALRRRDWWTAVRLYNGVGQEQQYIGLLEGALREIGQVVA